MALEGYPQGFGYNGTILKATSGYSEVLHHWLGNPKDVQAIGVDPEDWILNSVVFRIFPTSSSNWFIRGTVSTRGDLAATPIEIRANLFDYSDTLVGEIKTSLETSSGLIEITVPTGQIQLIFVLTKSMDVPFGNDANTRGSYAIVVGPDQDIDVTFEGRAIFQSVDTVPFSMYVADDSLFDSIISWPVPAP